MFIVLEFEIFCECLCPLVFVDACPERCDALRRRGFYPFLALLLFSDFHSFSSVDFIVYVRPKQTGCEQTLRTKGLVAWY